MNDLVRFIYTKQDLNWTDAKDAFEFRKDRPLRWIQRILFFLLRKIGAYRRMKELQVREVAFHVTYLMDSLMRQQHEVMQRSHDYRALGVLMGNDEFERLTGEMLEIGHHLTFKTPYHCRKEIFDMPIAIIPWMKGMLVVPRTVLDEMSEIRGS